MPKGASRIAKNKDQIVSVKAKGGPKRMVGQKNSAPGTRKANKAKR